MRERFRRQAAHPLVEDGRLRLHFEDASVEAQPSERSQSSNQRSQRRSASLRSFAGASTR